MKKQLLVLACMAILNNVAVADVVYVTSRPQAIGCGVESAMAPTPSRSAWATILPPKAPAPACLLAAAAGFSPIHFPT